MTKAYGRVVGAGRDVTAGAGAVATGWVAAAAVAAGAGGFSTGFTAGAVAAGSLAAFAAAASAHVTLQPKAQTAGAYTVVNVRVPNERDNASTTRLRVEHFN